MGVNDIPVTPRPGGLRPGIDFQDYGPDNDPLTPDPGQSNGQWDPGERLLLSSDQLLSANSADLALGLSYARQRGERLAFGGTLKFVRQSIPDTLAGEHVTSFGAGLDAGLLYMPSDAITVGAVVHDLTTTYLSWSNGTKELVSPSIVTGAAFEFHPAERHALTWATDFAWNFEDRQLDAQLKLGSITADVRTGLEYWYRSTFALRSSLGNETLAFRSRRALPALRRRLRGRPEPLLRGGRQPVPGRQEPGRHAPRVRLVQLVALDTPRRAVALPGATARRRDRLRAPPPRRAANASPKPPSCLDPASSCPPSVRSLAGPCMRWTSGA